MSFPTHNEQKTSLSNSLRQSLQDVLMDESLNDISMVNRISSQAPYGVLQQRMGGSVLNKKPLVSNVTMQRPGNGLFSSDFTNAHFNNLKLQMKPAMPFANQSAALGLNSNELILAAATASAEMRLLDQARAAIIRNQASFLKEGNLQRSLYNDSLRGLLLSSAGKNQFYQSPVEEPPKKDDLKESLEILGGSLRKNAPYVDVSTITDLDESNDTQTNKVRGGVVEPFPEKLYRMLSEVEEAGDSDVVSFFSHGRAFKVHDADRFVSNIMKKYFNQSRLGSFQRQLNIYGFKRITSGPDAGGYYHELFLKGRPGLCRHMRRVGVPQGDDRRKNKRGADLDGPDFYAMQAVAGSAK